jgi:redox-sensitive bicupin YhaK (pirin superfamily)
MIATRPSSERGHADHGWLNTYHTFSFADYHDPAHTRFRSLRVINEDVVAPGQGFGMHPHQDMEILTWIISGSLQHRDSMGHGEVIKPGDLQHMTAGSGILHSEFNPSKTEPVHLLQIWIMPEQRGLTPGYSQTHFPAEQRRNRLQLLASHDGRDGSIRIRQDVSMYAAALDAQQSVTHDLAPGRHAWLQVIRGQVNVNGRSLDAGDGASMSDENRVDVVAREASEFLLFDLA